MFSLSSGHQMKWNSDWEDGKTIHGGALHKNNPINTWLMKEKEVLENRASFGWPERQSIQRFIRNCNASGKVRRGLPGETCERGRSHPSHALFISRLFP